MAGARAAAAAAKRRRANDGGVAATSVKEDAQRAKQVAEDNAAREAERERTRREKPPREELPDCDKPPGSAQTVEPMQQG